MTARVISELYFKEFYNVLAELSFILLNPLFFLVFVAVIVVVCLWSQSPNLAIPQRALRITCLGAFWTL